MSTTLNRETGDYAKAVEQFVSVQIGSEMHTFSVWSSRYVADKLTREDWKKAGTQLREHVNTLRRRMALAGVLFHPNAPAKIRESVEAAMRHFIYEAFKARNRAEGNLEFQVDSLLAGSEYRV